MPLLSESAEVLPIHRRILAFSFIGWIFDFYDLLLLSFLVASTTLTKDLALSQGDVSILLGTALAFTAVGGLAGGALADRFGRKPLLMITILVYCAGTLLSGMAGGMWSLLAARAVTGTGVGGEWAVAHALVGETVPPRVRGRYGSYLQSGSAFARFFATVVGNLLAPWIGWRASFIVSAVPALLVVLIRRQMPESDVWLLHRRDRVAVRSLFAVVGDMLAPALRRTTVLATTVTTFNMAAYWFKTIWLPTYFHQIRGLSLTDSAWLLFMDQVGSVAGYVAFGFASDAFGRRPSFTAFSIVKALGLVMVTLGWDLAGGYGATMWAFMFIVGIGEGNWGCIGPLLNEVFPTAVRASALGIIYNVSRGVQFLAPIVIAAVAARSNFGAGIALAAPFALIAGASVWALPETKGVRLVGATKGRAATIAVVAALCAVGIGSTVTIRAQRSDGATLYDASCRACHESPAAGSRAPARDALRERSPESIVDALTGGAMRYQGLSLSGADRRAIAEYLTGKTFGGDITGAAAARCTSPPPLRDPSSTPMWNGWGPSNANTHFQSAVAAGVPAAKVASLTLKWAFGFPDTTSAWAQPSIVAGRLFVGSQNGTVYALDPNSGCVIWTFTARGGVRAAISIGRTDASPLRAFFSDQKGYAYAVDANDGSLVWSRQVETHPLIRLTGSPALHEGRLYVPTSSYEESGKGPTYACCTFRGSVVALDAASGEIVWRAYTITDEPKVMGTRADGIAIYGPAGGAIWSAPTIDAKRGVLYVGVGNTYAGSVTQPAANAIVAFDLRSGERRWAKQVAAPDIFGCRPGEANCGERPGPDFDFGASPVLTTLPNGKDVLIAGSKSGVGYAMDPDARGEILWEYRAGRGSALGGIEWGVAADGERAYFPVADGNSPTPGGLHAVTLTTGARAWFAPPPPLACGTPGRGCNGAQPAAITVIPGAVFSGSMDGAIRAFSTADGSVLWQFDTNRSFETVNHVPAHGGSLNGPAAVIVGGMVYVNSGYGAFGSRTGNVLLAFGMTP